MADSNSTSGSTNPDPYSMWGEIYLNLTGHVTWITAVASIIQTGLLFTLICKHVKTPTIASLWKETRDKFNSLILAMIFCNAGTAITYYISLKYEITSTFSYGYSLSVLLSAGYQIAMVMHLYRRGVAIFEAIFPAAVWIFTFGVSLFVFLQFVIAVFTIASGVYWPSQRLMYLIASGLFDTSLIVLFLIDVSVLTCFVSYLREARKSYANINLDRMKVIARFGIASCFWTLFSGAVQIPPIYLPWSKDMMILGAVYALAPLGYILLQLWMKWELQADWLKSSVSGVTPPPQACESNTV
ncbi:hypothetical protein HDU78_001502 [Chytriomyces hyalinus]|nr:hypothetical protein HDU78_001502 [Chytriomyces hyalinus]